MRLDTAAGFLHWRILSPLPLILGAYRVAFVSRATVRERRRGATDLVLSTPLARFRFVLERFAVPTLSHFTLSRPLAGVASGLLMARSTGFCQGFRLVDLLHSLGYQRRSDLLARARRESRSQHSEPRGASPHL